MIQVGGRKHQLGSFCDEEAAARTYDVAAREHFGPHAALNFPERGERSALQHEPQVDRIVWALVHRRRELGLSQRVVAERLGTWDSMVGQWEGGVHTPRLAWLHRWADALGLVLTVAPAKEPTEVDRG